MDKALKTVGGYRRYHLLIFFAIGYNCFYALCGQGFNIVFIGYEPPHHCKVPANQTLNDTIPHTVKDGQVVWDKCLMYQNLSVDSTTIPCTNGWTFYDEGYTTIVTEWELVCEKNYLVEVSQVSYQIACIVGELTVSFLVDRFGRKPIHIVASVLVGVTGTLTAFSVNYTMLVFMRAASAILVSATVLSGLALVTELFDSEKRTFAGIAVEGPWLMAFLPMALYAWAVPNWRHLQLVFSVLNFVWIIYIWILPESVPWLVATGKIEKAEGVLKKMAKWNGVKLTEPIKLSIDPLLEPQEKSISPVVKPIDEPMGSTSSKLAEHQSGDVSLKDVLELFRHRALRKHTILSMLLWLANCVVYYVLTLVSPMLPGDRFLNYFYFAIVELPAYVVTLFIVKRYGRRIPLCVFHILAGIPLVIMVFLPSKTASGSSLVGLSMSLMVMAKFAISATFAIIVLYTRELFPTTLRATGSGLCAAAGRMGSTIAPITAYAAKTSIPWLPSVICAVASTGVGILTLLLPETNNKQLPQNVDDIQYLYEKTTPKLKKKYLKDVNDVELSDRGNEQMVKS